MAIAVHRPHNAVIGLFGSLIAALLLSSSMPDASAAPAPVKRRGRLLRTEITRTERDVAFTCSLAPSRTGFVNILVHRLELLTLHETPIYEALLEIKHAEDEIDPTKIEYRVIPDEVIEGDPQIRKEQHDAGPLPNESFRLAGIPVQTNRDGIIADREQILLPPFDDLSVREATLTLSHERFGDVPLTVTRDLVRRGDRNDELLRAEMAYRDIPASLGLDFSQLRRSGNGTLRAALDCPQTIRPGQRFQVILTVTNTGDEPVSNLIGRIFSRHAWFSGSNFYFGNLFPGETRSFSRWFTPPADAAPGRAHAAIGMWNILGAMKQHSIPLAVSVLPDALPE